MSAENVNIVLGLREARQLQEVYDRAKAVKAKYPDTHVASQAAKKLIDAFEAEIHVDSAAMPNAWLLDARVEGNA